MVKVSVIIAVYNVEKYLEECLDSVINQTLEDIEIICINDGSTDSSLNILNNYAANDKRVKVISQKNAGRSSASNLGLSIAKGDYVYFVDSDDVVKLSALEETYNYALEKSADVVMFQAINWISAEDRYYRTNIYDMSRIVEFNDGNVFDYNDLDDLIFHIPVTPWSKIYKNSFLREIDAKFPEGLIFEDNIFYWDVIFNAKRIAFYEKCLYIRRRRSDSIMSKGDQRFVDSIAINNLMIDRFKKYGSFEKFKNTLYNRKVNLTYNRFVEIDDEFEDLYFDKLHEDYEDIVSKGLYDDYMNNLDERNKAIFDFCLNSKTYVEFKYQMAYWDSHKSFIRLTNENKMFKNKNDELNKINSIIIDDNELIKKSNSLLNNSYEIIHSQISKVKNENSSLKEQNSFLMAENSNLKEDNAIILKENAILKSDVNILSRENISLKKSNDIISRENNGFKKENNVLSGIIYDLKVKNNDLEKNINQLSDEKQNYIGELMSLASNIEMMRSENEMLVESNNNLKDELLQEKIKVSVVIPVYNVEEFLGECLDSIVNQTLKDIEIICVNDGSTDKSLEILNYYAENDDRFTVITQENGGHAVATNRGMELAHGKYLYLMDSDDFVELTTLEEAYNYAEEKNVDFVIFQSMNYVTDEDRYYKAENYSMEAVADFVGDSVFDYKDLGDLIFKITVTPWSKLYRTNFVRKCGAQFPEGLIFDDNIFFWEVLFSAERIAFYRKHLFNRRWYSYSSTTAGDQRFLDSIDINNLMIDRFKKFGAFDQFKETLYNRKVNMTYNRFVDIKPEFEEVYFEKLHADYEKVVADGFYDDYVEHLDHRNKAIFEFCLNSNTYVEFKYQMAFWDAIASRKKKDKVIGDLQKENKNMKKDVSTLRKERDSLKKERNDLKAKVKKLNDSTNKEIKTLKNQNQSLKSKNKALENKNSKLNDEISLYKSSNSWKLTKPLRNIKRKM